MLLGPAIVFVLTHRYKLPICIQTEDIIFIVCNTLYVLCVYLKVTVHVNGKYT